MCLQATKQSPLYCVKKKRNFIVSQGGKIIMQKGPYMLLTMRDVVNRMQVADEEELFISLGN